MKCPPSVVLPGSFRFYESHTKPAIAECMDMGLRVLMPRYGNVVCRVDGTYAVLDEDVAGGVMLTRAQIQAQFFAAIAEADFSYVVAPGGYYGNLVGTELGYAVQCGRPIIASEQLDLGSGRTPLEQSVIAQIPAMSIRQAAQLALTGQLGGMEQMWVDLPRD